MEKLNKSYPRYRDYAAWGIGQCYVLQGDPCPYYRKHCKSFTQWELSDTMEIPVCIAEQELFNDMRDSLVALEFPQFLSALYASALVRSRCGKDSLLTDTMNNVTRYSLALVQQSLKRLANTVPDASLELAKLLNSCNDPIGPKPKTD